MHFFYQMNECPTQMNIPFPVRANWRYFTVVALQDHQEVAVGACHIAQQLWNGINPKSESGKLIIMGKVKQG